MSEREAQTSGMASSDSASRDSRDEESEFADYAEGSEETALEPPETAPTVRLEAKARKSSPGKDNGAPPSKAEAPASNAVNAPVSKE